MVNAEPGPSSGKARPQTARAAGRICALAATFSCGRGAALIAGSAFFALPSAIRSSARSSLLVIVAAFRRRGRARTAGESAGAAQRIGLAGHRDEGDGRGVAEGRLRARCRRHRALRQRTAPRRLFPATRPGDAFTLTFRWPEFSEALEIAGAGQAASVEFREPGETTNTYSVTLSPLSAPGGAVGFILVTFDDVSDRLAIARMRADFVANASHELRTPLASLTGFIETLLGPARNDPATSEKFLQRHARSGAADAAADRRSPVALAAPRCACTAARPTASIWSRVLRHVARRACSRSRRSIPSRSTIDAPGEPVEIVGDRDELVQLVQNLVENAIRYGASGGRVDIRLEASARTAARRGDRSAGLRAGHCARASAAADRAFLPRRRRREPRR